MCFYKLYFNLLSLRRGNRYLCAGIVMLFSSFTYLRLFPIELRSVFDLLSSYCIEVTQSEIAYTRLSLLCGQVLRNRCAYRASVCKHIRIYTTGNRHWPNKLFRHLKKHHCYLQYRKIFHPWLLLRCVGDKRLLLCVNCEILRAVLWPTRLCGHTHTKLHESTDNLLHTDRIVKRFERSKASPSRFGSFGTSNRHFRRTWTR